MNDVVEKLANFLNEQDISVEEDEDTADLINKISEQIGKMLDDQKAPNQLQRVLIFYRDCIFVYDFRARPRLR